MRILSVGIVRASEDSCNNAVNCRRTRRPALLDPILAIVSASRKMSTKPDQAQLATTLARAVVLNLFIVTFMPAREGVINVFV